MASPKREQPKMEKPEAGKEIPELQRGGTPRNAELGSKDSLKREASPPSPLHEAAINGNKKELQQIIAGNPGKLDSGDQFGRTPMIYAVLGDRPSCLEILLKAGAKVDAKDSGGRTSLHWAAHKNNLQCLKMLLSKGAAWSSRDHEDQTPLHLVTKHRSTQCLAELLKCVEPGQIDLQDKSMRTPLHWAASYGNAKAVTMLINQDANIGVPDEERKTPLHWAATAEEKDHDAVNTVQILLESAASVANWQDFEGRTALHLAVADGNLQTVDMLTSVETGNISAADNMFRTALHWAAVLGHTQVVRLLLARGANHASTDSNGATPMHYAAQNNYAETVNTLLSHKNVVDEPDLEGRTALMWAAGKGADEVIEVMLNHRADDLNAPDKTGGTAIHAAALSGHPGTVKVLLKHGADVNATDNLKHTPLFRACEMGHSEVVETLIEGGAKISVTDQDGRSPLHWAALGGHAFICETLMRHGVAADINDLLGRTPLQCAAYGGFLSCMRSLLENGADPNAQDKEGMTALHWSCSSGSLDSIKLLFDCNAYSNRMDNTEDRFTPLDFALMGDHNNVAEYMIEQGALSITSIRDTSATKIQASYRGYRVRKEFLKRKQLLMKHEQLRREATQKKEEEQRRKAEEESKKKAADEEKNAKEKKEAELVEEPVPASEEYEEDFEEEQPADIVSEVEADDLDERFRTESSAAHSSSVTQAIWRRSKNKKSQAQLAEEQRLETMKKNAKLVKEERLRLASWKEKEDAANVIQRAWKNYRYGFMNITKFFREAINFGYRQKGEEEWRRQVAACTIQLAWRRYYRKKLLSQLRPNQRILHTWSPAVIAAKQRTLLEQIYGEVQRAHEWHPASPHKVVRPEWLSTMPSPAALSFNFAMDQYHPLGGSRRGAGRQEWVPDMVPGNLRIKPDSMIRTDYGWSPEMMTAGLSSTLPDESVQALPLSGDRLSSAGHYSYNLTKS